MHRRGMKQTIFVRDLVADDELARHLPSWLKAWNEVLRKVLEMDPNASFQMEVS